jgi:VIT1/CCC1 family predicted Fe2+/Mn2+ transporter
MIEDYKKLDLSKPLNVQENLKKSIMVTTGSSFVGAIIFIIVYIITKNLWMLSLGIILAFSGIAFMFIIKRVQEKYADILNSPSNSGTKNV